MLLSPATFPPAREGDTPYAICRGRANQIGILFLRFADDGRCEELREAWFFEPGDQAPHEGWGA